MVEDPQHPVLIETRRQLQEYFAGQRNVFDLPLDFAGTDFQKKVWQALPNIPYGQTRSYRDIAEQVGNIKASTRRGCSPMEKPDFDYCHPVHRVIGRSGKLVGFAGGLDKKRNPVKY